MKRFSLKQLVLPLAASLLTACGSGDESENQNSDPKPLVFDATNAYYFAMKDADGNWQEKEKTTYTLASGPYHIVFVCYNGDGEFSVYTEKSSYSASKGYEYTMCSASTTAGTKEITLQSANQNIEIVSISSPDLYIRYHSNDVIYQIDLKTIDTSNISAIGFDSTNNKAYAYNGEIDTSSTSNFIIDFLGDENSMEVSHKKVPDSANTDSLNFSDLSLINDGLYTDLSFSINGTQYYIDAPNSWKDDTSIYQESWHTDGYNVMYYRVGTNPTFEPRSITNESPLYTQDLELDLQNRTVTIDAADFKPTGLVDAYYELSLEPSMASQVSVYFYADSVDGQIEFNLVDFTNLPGFPTEQINGFAYEEEGFDVTDFGLVSYYNSEYWMEHSDNGEGLRLEAAASPTINSEK